MGWGGGGQVGGGVGGGVVVDLPVGGSGCVLGAAGRLGGYDCGFCCCDSCLTYMHLYRARTQSKWSQSIACFRLNACKGLHLSWGAVGLRLVAKGIGVGISLCR